MNKFIRFRFYVLFGSMIVIFSFAVFGAAVYASHSWGTYHWARNINPFNLNLGDNVSSVWDAYLAGASNDWSQSSLLDTTVVDGAHLKNCKPVSGRTEVCNKKYGFSGWLGVASIWVSDSHIMQGTVRLNDTYFNTAKYNTPAWRSFVMCQEIAHTLGLDHQDENFNNLNLGTCMDYTSNPSGPPSNEHPNQHDYEQLEAIYAHLDSSTSIAQLSSSSASNGDDGERPSHFGKATRKSSNGRSSLYVQDLGGGHKVFTFVTWAE